MRDVFKSEAILSASGRLLLQVMSFMINQAAKYYKVIIKVAVLEFQKII